MVVFKHFMAMEYQFWKKINAKTLGKGVSDLEARLDYCEDLARSFENLNSRFSV